MEWRHLCGGIPEMKTLSAIIQKLPPDQKAKVERRAAELINDQVKAGYDLLGDGAKAEIAKTPEGRLLKAIFKPKPEKARQHPAILKPEESSTPIFDKKAYMREYMRKQRIAKKLGLTVSEMEALEKTSK